MKRYAVIFFVLIVALMSVNFVNAQDPGNQGEPGGRPGGERGFGRDTVVLDVIAEATGLTRVEILRMMREDNLTLAEIIDAQGGDVEAVAASLETAITEEINERTAEQLENVGEMVDNLLYASMPLAGEGRRGDGRAGRDGDRLPGLAIDAARAIAEAASLDERDIIQSMREDDLTLAEIATANNLDPNEIAAQIATLATERINERVADGDMTQEEADAILAEQDERINELMNTTLEAARQQAAIKGAVVHATAEALDMNPRDFAESIEEGQTLADTITAQGGDIEAVVADAIEHLQNAIDEGVERGRLTEEEAAEMSAGLDAAVRAELNAEFERPNRPRR